MKPPPPASEPRSWLTSRLVRRADQLVRDVVSALSATAVKLDEATITAFRVVAGVALRDASLWSRQYQHTIETQAKSAALKARLPKVMVRADPFICEDEVTERMFPGKPPSPPPVVHVRGPKS